MYFYSDPSILGLQFVGEIEWAEPDYSFDLCGVWKAKRGEYYYASDSGCSCPAPFEDVSSLADLKGPYDKKALEWNLKNEIKERAGDQWRYNRSFAELTKDLRNILDKLK